MKPTVLAMDKVRPGGGGEREWPGPWLYRETHGSARATSYFHKKLDTAGGIRRLK